jgi:hypothetical protein
MADPIKVPIKTAGSSPESETAVVNEDIRHFIWDRTIEDNPLELDLEFSDKEIGHARRFAVKMFNSIPPYVETITADKIPLRWEYGFMLGTVYHLFLAKLMSLQRKDLDYSAGNMTVDINKKRIDYLSKWVEAFKKEATENIKSLKVSYNLESGYAYF